MIVNRREFNPETGGRVYNGRGYGAGDRGSFRGPDQSEEDPQARIPAQDQLVGDHLPVALLNPEAGEGGRRFLIGTSVL
ncbi:MAG: hypothetical protein CM1200mP14_08720 [Gammaproteobacteria bacterium]|nr:MAG: hypothetical protein CM1200mP14_08720 [Gammaproteobacteria bacterium]